MKLNPRITELRQHAQRWWEARNQREQWLLGTGAVLALLLVPYVAVWEPLAERAAELEAQVAAQRADLVWMRGAAEQIRAHGGSGAAAPVIDERSLLSLVDRTARQAGLDSALTRVQPDGQGVLRVWMERTPFDTFTAWLAELERSGGVRITALTIERTNESGRVNARLTLELDT